MIFFLLLGALASIPFFPAPESVASFVVCLVVALLMAGGRN